MCFLREGWLRSAVEDACPAEGCRQAGARCRSARPRSASRRSRRCRASTSSCSRRRSIRTPSAALSRTQASGTRSRCLRRLALVPYRHVQGALRRGPARPLLPGSRGSGARRPVRDLPPAVLDEHRAELGARAAVPPAVPQRRDQHHRQERDLERGGECARGKACPLAPALDPSGSDSALLDNALELLVREDGAEIAEALSVLVPPAWQNDPRLDDEVRTTSPLRRDLERALGRTGRALLHGRPDVWRGTRPQRPPAASRRRSQETSFSQFHPRQGLSRSRTASPCAGRGWGRAA